jgi:hypothetical protein
MAFYILLKHMLPTEAVHLVAVIDTPSSTHHGNKVLCCVVSWQLERLFEVDIGPLKAGDGRTDGWVSSVTD